MTDHAAKATLHHVEQLPYATCRRRQQRHLDQQWYTPTKHIDPIVLLQLCDLGGHIVMPRIGELYVAL